MKRMIAWSLALALVVLAALGSSHAADKKTKAPDPAKQLIPLDMVEKLELTAEQKEKLAPVQKEFEQAVHKARDKAKDKKDAAERINKARTEIEPKALEILTDEQKTKLEELKKAAPPPEEEPK